MSLRRWWCGKVGHRKPLSSEALYGASDLALGDCSRCGVKLLMLCGVHACEWTDRMEARHAAMMGAIRAHQVVLREWESYQATRSKRDSHLLN